MRHGYLDFSGCARKLIRPALNDQRLRTSTKGSEDAMNGEITRNQLLELVKELVQQKRAGTLYVHTDDNHLIIVGVEGGNIVSLICGPKQGERAIPIVRRMKTGTYRLEDGVMTHRTSRSTLPSSETLLSLLSEEETAEVRDTAWVQSMLCKVLAGYLGPIAPLVCKEAVSRAGGIDSSEKLQRVVENLAGEIDSLSEAERFRVQAQKELGNLLT
ncbi:MAG: hypothetical protein U9Q81_21875 [Pseudomonadota bacterium]|nr:hypothetical protein [Pseudomonadota bacterium]